MKIDAAASIFMMALLIANVAYHTALAAAGIFPGTPPQPRSQPEKSLIVPHHSTLIRAIFQFLDRTGFVEVNGHH